MHAIGIAIRTMVEIQYFLSNQSFCGLLNAVLSHSISIQHFLSKTAGCRSTSFGAQGKRPDVDLHHVVPKVATGQCCYFRV
jgi:hypothetical protein